MKWGAIMNNRYLAGRLSMMLLVLCLLSGILLFSDWENRNTGPVSAHLQNSPRELWIISSVVNANYEQAQKGILAGLQDSGLKQGQDYTVVIRNAQGDMSTLTSIMDAAAAAQPDLIFAINTPTLQAALQRLSPSIPLVFTNVADPMAAGAGTSYTEHLPHVTGLSSLSDFAGMVDLVLQIKPQAKRIGTLFVPAEVNSVVYKDHLEKAAVARGLQLVSVPVNSSAEMTEAAQMLCSQKLDAICQISDNLTGECMATIIKVSQKAKVPLFTFVSDYVAEGAALSWARDYYQGGKDAASVAVRILRGENPQSIPFATFSHTRLFVNPDAAKACGLSIPPALLEKAEIVSSKD